MRRCWGGHGMPARAEGRPDAFYAPLAGRSVCMQMKARPSEVDECDVWRCQGPGHRQNFTLRRDCPRLHTLNYAWNAAVNREHAQPTGTQKEWVLAWFHKIRVVCRILGRKGVPFPSRFLPHRIRMLRILFGQRTHSFGEHSSGMNSICNWTFRYIVSKRPDSSVYFFFIAPHTGKSEKIMSMFIE